LIEWVEEQARFEELAGPWERLAEAAAYPFVRYGWLHTWWQAFGAGRRLAICTAWESGELVGAFPLSRRGRRLEAMQNVHSPVFRLLARDDEVRRELVEAAVGATDVSLLVDQLPEDAPAIPMLVDAACSRRMVRLVQSRHVSPVVRLDGFELAKKTGKELARLRRRLEDSHDVVFSPVEPPGDLESELADGFELEANGWKGARHTAVLHSPETRAFYYGVARAFAGLGKLRLSRICVDGRTIAFDFCLLDHGRLWILKGGYDEAFRRYAPGFLLTLAQVERAQELGLDTVELLGDRAHWKEKFANDWRPHRLVHLYRRRPAPLARYAYRRAVRPCARRLYHRVRPPRG
jgi:CelD/BcsL family acetyltransferase involved in cellulose biosynthesis